MAMKQCPKCGEEYSSTYKRCPFCEDEESMQNGGARRSKRRVSNRSRQFSLITPTLIILILLMAGLLVYLLYGDKIADKFGKNEDVQEIPVEDPLAPVKPEIEPENPIPPLETDSDDEEAETEPSQPTQPDTQKPEQPDSTKPELTKPEPTKPETVTPKPAVAGYEKADALPEGLKLSSTDFTVKIAGEVNQLKVSGGSGSYQWYSEDPKVASVDGEGKVTALSGGTVKIVVTDGTKKGVCIVRVNLPKAQSTDSQPEKPTSATLSKTDYTTHVGDPDVQLKVSGASGAVTWSTADSSVATVSKDGLVKAVGKGHTTISASFDGSVLRCIVRVG